MIFALLLSSSSRNFSCPALRRSSSTALSVRCFAGAPGDSDVPSRAGVVDELEVSKFIKMMLTVFQFSMTVATLCINLESSFSSFTIVRISSAASLSDCRIRALIIAGKLPVNPSDVSVVSPLHFDLSLFSAFLKVISRCRALNDRTASSEGVPPFQPRRPSDAICAIMDFKVSFPTANPLFAAKIRHSPIIDSSSLVRTVGAPALYVEGLNIFCRAASSLLRKHFLILESVDLATFVAWAISRSDLFPSLSRHRACFRLFPISRSVFKAFLRSFVCLRIDFGMPTSLDLLFWLRKDLTTNNRTTKALESCNFSSSPLCFSFPGTHLYS